MVNVFFLCVGALYDFTQSYIIIIIAVTQDERGERICMVYNDYMYKLVRSFRDNRINKYMFIKHYETLFISEKEIHDMVVEGAGDLCFLFYEFPLHAMQEAYAPFLGWIRELYYGYFKDESPEEFVKNAGVYPLQQEVFVSFIKTNKATRMEDILVSEVAYEKCRMLDSIVKVYNYIGTRKSIFIFFERFHLASASSVSFLYELIKNDSVTNIRILAMYNELYRIPEYISDIWDKFTLELEKQDLQYEWNSINTESTIDAQDIFIPNETYMEEYIAIANNMFHFLAVDDAKYYMEILYEKIEQEVLNVKTDQLVRFLELFSLIEVIKGEYTRALQLCERVGTIGKKLQDDDILYNYNYIAAITQCGMEQVENKVERYMEKCKQIARKRGDKLAEYKSELLRLLSNYNYWRDVFENPSSYKISDEFLKQTEAFGFKNMLAHCYVHCFENDLDTVRGIVAGRIEPVYFNKGLQIATEIENFDFLVAAYTKNIVLFSNLGCYDYIDVLYQRKLEILEQEKNRGRKVHTYNGLGYNASVAEKYQKAEEYFNHSLNEALAIKDGVEVAITLYNSATNKMTAREFGAAAEDLNLLIRVMDMLEIHSITICNTSRILGLLGFCSFHMGEEYRCYLCLNRIEAYVGHLEHVDDEDKYKYWHDTLFFKYMIQGMLFTQEGKMDKAEKAFDMARYHQELAIANVFFNYPLFVMELAKFYAAQNREEERVHILEEGINFCNARGYNLKSNMMHNELMKSRESFKRVLFPRRDASTDKILEVIEGIAVKKQLESSKRDIGFLTIWQELLNKSNDAEDMLAQAVTLLKNHFNLDGVLMISMDATEPRMAYFDGPESNQADVNVTNKIRQFTRWDLEKIMSYFRRHKHALLTSRIDKGFLEYKGVLDIFGIHHVITFFAAPLNNQEGQLASVLIGYVEMRNNFIGNRHLLKDHDLVILKFVSNQLYIAIERLNHLDLIKRMNSQLSDMAVTDLLTGLYNRQGFEKRIREDQGKQYEENAVLYLDLDNFKYYNDTFGHEVGDFVLVRFAQLLERVVDHCGYAVRYGGDEFVLVLNGKDVEFGKKVAKNIFYMLNDGLHSLVEQKIGYSVVIPKDKMLSCSIGIASCHGYNMEEVSEALNKADKGLYYVKKTTKNSYVVWDELKAAKG